MQMISFAITACNEHVELKRLLDQIELIKKDNDEIVILLDSNFTPEVKEIAFKYNPYITPLNGDFASFKNTLKQYCTKDYIILQLDADEQLSDSLLLTIHELISLNPHYDCFALPRINTIKNIETRPDLIQQWGWKISKLDNYIEEKVLDLDNEDDIITYNYLKSANLIVEEIMVS